ncbi:Hypothetical predicted protein [Mytilus galloprovincialis]|nr:Hypothetical predicted protein [Mytilus galloprovincialis]
MKEITSAFKEMDANGDGKVVLQETISYMEKKKQIPESDHTNMAESIFTFYDKNKDGHIVLSEFLPHDEL